MVTELILFLSFFMFGPDPGNDTTPQRNRVIPSQRRVSEIKIDGVISPGEWKNAAHFHSFTELRPTPGKLEEPQQRTEAYLVYDDEGIYFGGTAFERSKDEISTELIGRDGFGNNDFVGIVFDTYQDRLNAFEYFITPLNEQMDARVAPSGNGNDEDFSWNSVFESATTIHDNGWSWEIFIPLASIRFSPKESQDWGLNIVRRRRVTGQQLFWSAIDPNINGFLTQEGFLTGLVGIKPPVRLQFSPYLSFYGSHFPYNTPGVNNYQTQINGGMDIKWGINQAFTLDATLIPDFGQVQSDPNVLNLTPFEVRFNENRNFFTEGTELFNRGNLFYSRRIGGTPLRFYDAEGFADSTETLISNPSAAKLLNASKVSGRTNSGLGIGILNAITEPSYAAIENNENGTRREVQTSPLTNYNVLVFNQSLKYNSSVSFINTSVMRGGEAYSSNVSAFMFDLNDKTNTWNIGGQFNGSAHYNDPSGNNLQGYSHSIYAGKTSGTYRFNIWQELADKTYSSNDLGFFTNNNYVTQGFFFGINRPKPYKQWNSRQFNTNWNYSRLLLPFGTQNPMYQNARINVNIWGGHKNLDFMGFFGDITFAQNDFYEPRVANRYFRRGASSVAGVWYETNSAKPFSFNHEIYVRRYFDFYDFTAVDLFLSQNWRANDRFSMRLAVNNQFRFNSMGFSSFDDADNPIFARREIRTIETSLRGKYSFTNRMGLTLVARHYASSVKNSELYDLNTDGTLTANAMDPVADNRTVNFFNIDMVYTWQIAQGSFVSVVWKSAIANFQDGHSFDYAQNFRSTLNENQNNNLSFRMIYFLDYATMRKSRRV